ncbi:MAG: PEP-CTERM sorting domain-containing protein [candidate division Zixibacteria bacterium]|nr:PEP-CTERM sorting domain-containing protein [candidate division Zixibacteria bacterium]
MTFYKKKEHHSLKWLLAAIIFIIALSVTFSDVYGFTYPNQCNNNPNNTDQMDLTNTQANQCDGDSDNPDKPPDDIPEPATIILLAAGLGGIYWKSRKSAK